MQLENALSAASGTLSRLCDQVMALCLPPFLFVGVDFFGPILAQKSRRRQVNRYGYVFTSLAIRAVHVEIAHTRNQLVPLINEFSCFLLAVETSQKS